MTCYTHSLTCLSKKTLFIMKQDWSPKLTQCIAIHGLQFSSQWTSNSSTEKSLNEKKLLLSCNQSYWHKPFEQTHLTTTVIFVMRNSKKNSDLYQWHHRCVKISWYIKATTTISSTKITRKVMKAPWLLEK